MKPAFYAPRELLQRKAPHGAPCTRCGLCCIATQCELSRHVFGERPNGTPCPALGWDAEKHAFCRLTTDESLPQPMKDAAAHLVRAGQGCDARFNGEPVNHAFDAELDLRDLRCAAVTAAARKTWGLS